MEQKRGGSRTGAGRKPSGIEKKTISLYVPKGHIYKFGNEDKMKKELYWFIEKFGMQDLNKPTNVIKPFEQPKSNYDVSISQFKEPPILDKFDAFCVRIFKTTMQKELEPIIADIRVAIMLKKEKDMLFEIAKKHAQENFYTD